MKTTIDIPEPLYRRAKIHAAETGTTLEQLILNALAKEVEFESDQTTLPNEQSFS